MSQRRFRVGRRVSAAAAAGLLAAALVASTMTAQARTSDHEVSGPSPAATSTKTSYSNGNYVVLMKGEPASVYKGGVSGYRATFSARGAYDSSTREAAAYTGYLKGRQNAVASSVGANAYYHYTTALNGFAARLTASQAVSLTKQPGVLAVVRDKVQHPDLINTPTALGLTGPVGLWRRLGGSDTATGAGKGLVIGIIDSGINDELEVDGQSFADTGTPPPADWNGICDTGEDDTFACNDKVIGGRYFNEAAVANGDVNDGEFISPDDFHGHGTHVGSTAAGAYGVESEIYGVDYGTIGGMAPAAKLAAYKVCWEKVDESNCSAFDSDSVAAIDAAVSDGVDVINYSISGTSTNVIDPVELAYMYAADAGVFVAASAGNSGPAVSTVAHPSPWLTSVAAATYVNTESTVLLGDGTRMIGASISPVGVDESPLVYAGDIPADGATVADAARCFPDTIDPAEAAGAIVICDRGVNPRVEKGTVVFEAGGVGMVLVNVPPTAGVTSDVQQLPAVHLESNYRPALLAYAETVDPTASILAGDAVGSTTPAPPAIAGFSSRGPLLAAEGDLLKPDIAAPGVDVNAATAPEGSIGLGNDFAVISGTSMASPHIAGLAALILQKHPSWSPMEVKSAMMTTAKDLTDTKNPFDQGAGFVRPNQFLDPGLAYNSDFDDWADYLSGQGVTVGGVPFTDTPIKASNLNVPSIAVNNLAGRETVARSVTNVDDTSATYKASIQRLGGIEVKVKPSTLTVAPGKTKSFKVTFTRVGAAFDTYKSGTLTWTGGGHIVRSPIVISPAGVDAPPEVPLKAGTTISTKSGFTGTMAAKVSGLVAPVDTEATADNSEEAGDPLDDANYFQDVEVTGPNQVIRVETLPENEGDDLDLYFLDETGATVASSATAAGDETVTVSGLDAGTYAIAVEAFALTPDRPSTDFTVRMWTVGKANAGNLTITPKKQAVKTAKTYSWKAKTSDLEPDTSYLGAVRWAEVKPGPDNVVGMTIVSVR